MRRRNFSCAMAITCRPGSRACSGDDRGGRPARGRAGNRARSRPAQRRQRVERRPMPRAGRAENADGRRSQRGSNVQQARVVRYREIGGCQRQDGIAQIGAREVADRRRCSRANLLRQRRFVRAADDHRRLHHRRANRAATLGETCARPSLRRSNCARVQARSAGARVVEIHARAPGGHLRGRTIELGQRPFCRQLRPLRQRQRGALVDHARQRTSRRSAGR